MSPNVYCVFVLLVNISICHGHCRLRLLAESKGYRLDDTGLFPATQGAKATASLKLATEKQVTTDLCWLENKGLDDGTLRNKPERNTIVNMCLSPPNPSSILD
ncbi:unnamed protein product [Microthlaspi erraticum]|uniref:Uncharacterized protein n=1 Tax=Microthlaspi erraticum TaxID=1685480 RepID=A0A6D2LHX5_9BRAS|nr:unnamed protein product [Microthlaspi erraticum]CAA7060830.1 unnamed protein product [Microthlaspi erraticum]